MKYYLLLVFLLFGTFPSPGAGADKTPPNIILIIGDDISAEDIGCYGNTAIHTPHIDQLAKEGMRFTNFYLTSSSCSPSRTSILTGRYPHNTGAAELHTPLPEHLDYFPELLKKAGYYTALLGKWHEGPATRRAYDLLSVGPKENGPGGEEQWITALQSRPKDKPFFFWLATFDAHRDWSADQFQTPHNPASEVVVPPTLLDTKETREDLASYYNEIGRIDYYLGELQAELKRQGIADNTIIIFMADNGRPFPGSKTRVYDTGMRSPFVIHWPAGIKKTNATCESLVSSIDLAPTLLQLAETKPSATIQGVSFAKLLQNPQAAFRQYVFSEHNWHDYSAYERAVRTKDYLYLINKRPQYTNEGPIDANQSPSALALRSARQSGTLSTIQNDVFMTPRPEEEFFDCRTDPIQETNLISDPAYKGQVARLRNILEKWQEKTGDTVPETLTPDWYDRTTGKPLPAKGTRGEMPGQARQADKINHKGPF